MVVNSNDILLDMDENNTASNSSGIDLGFEDENKKSNDNIETSTDTDIATSTDNQTDSDIDLANTDKEDDSDIDLEALFNELDDANEAIDKIESNKGGDNSDEIGVLKDSLSKMEGIVKKLTNEKADLVYRNAELEAFGGDGTDPKILLLSRNLSKANEGDDKAKTKTISILKDMLYNLTGEDFEQEKINKDVDILSAVEKYNSVSNPNLKNSKAKEENTLDIF